MLWPSRIARMAPSATGAGTPVSQTPWARLMPPTRSHSCVIARISDCTARGARSPRVSFEVGAGTGIGASLGGLVVRCQLVETVWLRRLTERARYRDSELRSE